jgi:hypothetical protein
MIMFAIAFGIGLGALKKAGHGDLWQVNTLESVLSQVRYGSFKGALGILDDNQIRFNSGDYLVLIRCKGTVVLSQHFGCNLKKPKQA